MSEKQLKRLCECIDVTEHVMTSPLNLCYNHMSATLAGCQTFSFSPGHPLDDVAWRQALLVCGVLMTIARVLS